MKRFRLFLLIPAVVILLFPVLCGTEGENPIELREKEWIWEGNNIASFEGKVPLAGMPEGKLTLRLSFTTEPKAADPGDIVFQTVNGKKLTLKKQKSEYVYSHDGQEELSFIGNWKTPDDVFFTRVEINFQICTEDGNTVLNEQKLTVSRTTSEMLNADDGKIRLKADFSAWTVWAFIAAGAVWIAAVIRILLTHISRKKER